MTSSPYGPFRRRVFFAALLVSGSLLAVPIPFVDSMRGVFRSILKPGMVVAGLPVAAARDVTRTWRSAKLSQQEVDAIRARVQHLENRLSESQARAAQYQEQLQQSGEWRQLAPKFQHRLVPANVIGRQATVLLRGMGILSVGRNRGVVPHALVIDMGLDAGLAIGDPVLGGQGVIGKIHEAGPHTCLLRVLTDPGFTERVEVRRDTPTGQSIVVAQGLLEGVGDGTCRLTHVSIEHDIREGDSVMTSGHQPVLPHPLVYGRIARVERQPADLDWTISVTPAAGLERLRRVYVVTAELSGSGLAQSR